ncbi:Flp pilus assembly protein CpaB [Hydrogenophaga sp. T2]|uniref:Flp pilus assembly protein CpaB n=1 Tax=Hydrogenophaga sp. T2 TaxID=3132823 RepID=UPI003CF022E8
MKPPAAFTRLKPNRLWIVLGVALSIGLAAALGARSYLASQLAAIEAQGKGRMVEVVVAKVDLAKGERLSSDNLALRPVPADFVHSLALRPEQFDRVDGKALAFDAKGGEAILLGMVEGTRVPTFSARVAPGRRALTVPVDEINAISGLLEPGDLIDLVLTLDHQGRKRVFPLLQAVTVMATGQRAMDDPRSGESRLYATVTLDADPAEARNLIAARELGKLTALLRHPQDKAPLPGAPRDLLAWLAGGGNPLAREVPVLYGGRAGKVAAGDLHLGPRAGEPRP